MLNYGVCFLFLILLNSALCSVASSPYILRTEEYLRLILAFATNELNVRLISKVFKTSFDEACNYEVTRLDPRFRTLTRIPPPLRIPVQIPLLFLLKDFIVKEFIESSSAVVNQDYPLVEDEEMNKRNDFDRFADIITEYIDDQFYTGTLEQEQVVQVEWSPRKLYNFYRFLQLSLPEKDFATEILPSVKFPLMELLKYAAAGAFTDPINQNLLIEYQEFINPNSGLVFIAFRSSRLDLVRILIALPSGGQRLKNLADDESRGILHYAANAGDLDLVISCLNYVGCNINKFDSKREKAIHKAAAKGHINVVNYLYQRGSPVNSVSYNPSPILKAVENNHFDVVYYILYQTNFRSDDQTESVINFNFKLIAAAIKNNNYEMVNLLLNSRKLSYDQNMIWKLMRIAGRIENSDFRIERILEYVLI